MEEGHLEGCEPCEALTTALVRGGGGGECSGSAGYCSHHLPSPPTVHILTLYPLQAPALPSSSAARLSYVNNAGRSASVLTLRPSALWLKAPPPTQPFQPFCLLVNSAPQPGAQIAGLGLCPGPSLPSLSAFPGPAPPFTPAVSAWSLTMPPFCLQIQGFRSPWMPPPKCDPRPLILTVSQTGLSISPKPAPPPGALTRCGFCTCVCQMSPASLACPPSIACPLPGAPRGPVCPSRGPAPASALASSLRLHL